MNFYNRIVMQSREEKCPNCNTEFISTKKSERGGWKKFCSKKCIYENQKRGKICTCKFCERNFYVAKCHLERIGRGKQGTFCSIECKSKWQSKNLNLENNPNWSGGKFTRKDGYVAIRLEGGEYELEHRVVMAKHIGRTLEMGEHIHHRNGIKHDNRIENLELVGVGEHISKYHARQRQEDRWVECECLNCGKFFQRIKLEVERHPNTFCDRKCYIEGKRKGLSA